MLKMKIVIFCQALLSTTLVLVTSARPTSPHSIPGTPELNYQVDLSGADNMLSSDTPPSSEDLKQLENPDLFEGDLLISAKEIELYYGKQSNSTHVRLISEILRYLFITVFIRIIAEVTINFSLAGVRVLIEGSYYSRAAFKLPVNDTSRCHP